MHAARLRFRTFISPSAGQGIDSVLHLLGSLSPPNRVRHAWGNAHQLVLFSRDQTADSLRSMRPKKTIWTLEHPVTAAVWSNRSAAAPRRRRATRPLGKGHKVLNRNARDAKSAETVDRYQAPLMRLGPLRHKSDESRVARCLAQNRPSWGNAGVWNRRYATWT